MDEPAPNHTIANYMDMAQYWGNYLFREWLLHPAISESVALGPMHGWSKGPSAQQLGTAQQRNAASHGSIWQRWRALLRGGDDIESSAGQKNLNAVRDLSVPKRARARLPHCLVSPIRAFPLPVSMPGSSV